MSLSMFDENFYFPGATGLGVIIIWMWTKRDKLIEIFQSALNMQISKSLEQNANILTEVYEEMQWILNSADYITNVAIIKYHNGMDKLTPHSNIHQTMIHELSTRNSTPMKEDIQGIPCDGAGIDLLLKLISDDKANGKVTVVHDMLPGISSRIYSMSKINRYFSYCLYTSKAYFLIIHVYCDKPDLINEEDITKMHLGALKVEKLLNNN